ncbi:MAG: peptide chain release factor N(5)-glutamine methyltransferase [Timaviella obliquedivisa GSE-PSE-MK23-08B]|nr:peptide chain release factor N(5)-glutamine methyltransferase [Timaviella obliquedivisa GSE-PSE-MK23-08B]
MPSSASGLELWHWRSIAKQQAVAAHVLPTEVDWLLQEVAGLDRLSLRLESFKNQAELPLKLPLTELTQLWQQRLETRLPVQYIVGSTTWRQFSLVVSPAVLIPRPETEELIDLAIATVQADPALGQGAWVDLGTGSGAIALALADAFPHAAIHAVDVSELALAIAQYNAQQLHLSDRIQFHQGRWFEPIASLQHKLSGIVSNPPYIPRNVIPNLQPEVAQHEPHLALDGGEDGLDCIRQLVNVAPDYLRSGGAWLIEMMAGQAEAVSQLLEKQGNYRAIEIHTDLNGIERFASALRV